jgi:hypothetical protein
LTVLPARLFLATFLSLLALFLSGLALRELAVALTAPSLKTSLAYAPTNSQLFLIEVNDFHLGLLPNELVGVHERAVPRASQAIS